MVTQSNHEVVVVCWFSEQALLCSSRFVSVLFAFPEDFGGIPVSRPAITCELHQCVAACCSIPLRARGTTRSVRAPNQLAVSSSHTYVWAGLHDSPPSFLGTTTAHSIPLADARMLTSLCGEQTCMRSSAPLHPHFAVNSLWCCVAPQPCSKVEKGQVRGVVCDATAEADIQVQDFFCRSSVRQLMAASHS